MNMIMWFIISMIIGLSIGLIVYITAKFIYDDLHNDDKGVTDNEQSEK